jgi:diguanylate cyclase (GGDEF)-like protein
MLKHFNKIHSQGYWFTIGVGLVAILGLVDTITGYEISFSLFYLVPIALVSWKTNRALGIMASFLSAITWLSADLLAGNSYSNPLIFAWNTGIRLGFFIITVYLMSALRKALERERELSRVDTMTGAYNNRYFKVLLQMEIDRSRRYPSPITVAYIDLDNFKAINDELGHSIGDLVLRQVAANIMANLRLTDIVARLGGDEFAIMLPETSLDSAETIFTRLRQNLLEEMKRKNWPVTFSIGVISCTGEKSSTVDDIINRADHVMYSVKRQGKNAIQYISLME